MSDRGREEGGDIAGAREAAAEAAEVAALAGSLLLGYFRRDVLATDLKPDYSLVTEADVAADRLVAEELARRFPGDRLLSEELAPEFSAGRGATWVIDPLDGTTNFSLGVQHWGVSIARCREDGPDVGVMCFPALGELYVASRGAGATCNGETIRVRAPSASRPLGLLACCSRTARLHHVNLPVKIRVFGSAAWTLACVARGSAALGMETTPRIWDLAAGWCLVEEAGGVVSVLDGSRPFPLAEGVGYASASFPVLAAASRELAAEAREHIEPR